MKKNKLKNNKWKEWIWFQVWNKNIQQKMFQEQKKNILMVYCKLKNLNA